MLELSAHLITPSWPADSGLTYRDRGPLITGSSGSGFGGALAMGTATEIHTPTEDEMSYAARKYQEIFDSIDNSCDVGIPTI